ncbi:hypothetical protein JMJ76_0001604 [Colletotrichum scovillei]|nr:hypothetical protein JMJ76_0001604 [Colletotrichum scovillei]KAG7078599.1 hypothetical protein JMJ78_0002269 [Colletotrichum scovillei]
MQTLVDILVLRPESTYLGIQFFGNLGNVDITQQTTEFEMGTWNYSPQRLYAIFTTEQMSSGKSIDLEPS